MTIGATELGKAVFEQGLKLTQAAAEDYVKDFFKGCLKEGVAAAKPEVAKKAVAGALQAFLLLVMDELEDQDLSKAEIRDRSYEEALAQFVKNDQVKPILGQAFEKDCGAIDHAALASCWGQSTLRGKPFPALPEGFDWQRIGSEYLKKVRRIVRETPELRSLLKTALLEDIARQTANLNTQISPGFDVAKYRDSLQTSYGYLKLSTIDTTDQQYRVKLWRMFIEQTVREDLRQTSEVLKTSEVSELEHDRREYFQQPSRKVLEALAASPPLPPKSGGNRTTQSPPVLGDLGGKRAVILGDPGAGKSTLLQYLALAWVESQTSEVSKTSEVSARLPLLIELREYAIAQTNSFLDFLHRGRGVDWQFDQQQLHQYLQEHPTLVMFDGLDEVFDRPTQAAITDDIIRFAQQYPHAQILITSRIIGYNPERLQHAGFRHFTIQPLDTEEIHEFIDRWYTLALGNDPDKDRLVTRLKDAIANSPAIRNLADNPLLLTMMAILNRRQELPRDRADLYDQASRVLLYHWDVDHKKLNLPLDTIGRREKQEMLRLIAYDMQAGEDGLKGNLISADRLTHILTDYLRDQGFSEPREKANKLIDQLRHRNFILCDRGADTYGFVHRTFLEYFCAVEIVHRFEKQRTLTFEQLRDEVFGQHWQDETWHEVLKLICGMIAPKLVGALIEYLINLEVDRTSFLKEVHNQGKQLRPEGLANLLLAVDCLLEARNNTAILQISNCLLGVLKEEIEHPSVPLHWETTRSIIRRIAGSFSNTLLWLKQCFSTINHENVREAVVYTIPMYYQDDPQTFVWLQECLSDKDSSVRMSALIRMSDFYKEEEATWEFLLDSLVNDWHSGVRWGAVLALSKNFLDRAEAFDLLYKVVKSDPFVREFDWDWNPRKEALDAIFINYPTHPKTLELLRDRAANDPDEKLREWRRNN